MASAQLEGMGNAGGKAELENGRGGIPAEKADGEESKFVLAGQLPSAESMAETLPPTPQSRLRPPLLYAHQRTADPRNFPDVSIKKGIPTLISWHYGGNAVAVEGSWDNWSSRRTLHRSGKDYTILLVLSSGVFHYKFIVDGEWRFIPNLPHLTNFAGHTANILEVTDYVPENLESISEFEVPTSPESSYRTVFPADDEFAKEPPALPPQLPLIVPGSKSLELEGSSIRRRPHHVELNHLFVEKGWASQSLVALNFTHRFQSKYVTVALYKSVNN